jgi:peptidoglycan pentaglycine glycine transferase (the first glycine)
MKPHDPHWNEMIALLPGAHFMQTSQWAEVKVQTDWVPLYRVWYPDGDSYQMDEWKPGTAQPSAAALVLQRTISLGGFSLRLRILYVPKGPLLDWANIPLRQKVLSDLRALARRQGAIFIKIDPDVPLGTGLPNATDATTSPLSQSVLENLQQQGWLFSAEQPQFRNTVVIDLNATEEELMSRMKQKTRYNVRLAERKGVILRKGNPADLPVLYQMYAETAVRDRFVIRPEAYYNKTWRSFLQAGLAEIWIAEAEGEILAALILFVFAKKTWYVYGMSRHIHREMMPNYLLQWQAMRRGQILGCSSYDLWGAPNGSNETDPLWNVYRFKEGLGGVVVRHIGAWDLPTQPLLYHLYTHILPRILDSMRKKSKDTLKKNAAF